MDWYIILIFVILLVPLVIRIVIRMPFLRKKMEGKRFRRYIRYRLKENERHLKEYLKEEKHRDLEEKEKNKM